MLRGLAQLIFFADDLAAAKQWYCELLAMEPYFERLGPDGSLGYMEFRVGDYQHELGLIDRRFAPHGPAGGPAGSVANWHVDDVTATLEKLLSMGAKEHEPRTERGSGFVTASVVDPFGNILGITYNPLRGDPPASARSSCRTSSPTCHPSPGDRLNPPMSSLSEAATGHRLLEQLVGRCRQRAMAALAPL